MISRQQSTGLLTLASLALAVGALYVARDILLPIALATLLSFLLAPLADQIERVRIGPWRIGRLGSVLGVAVVTFAVLGSLGWIVTSQLIDLSSQLPTYKDRLKDKVQAVSSNSQIFSGVVETFEDVKNELTKTPQSDSKKEPEREDSSKERKERDDSPRLTADELLDERALADEEEPVPVNVTAMPESPLSQIVTWLGPLVTPLTTAGIVVVLVIFMLMRREDHRNRIIRLFGATNLHATTEAITDIVDRVSRYLRMQFLINASYGIAVGVGLAAIGVPSAIMWTVLSFSLRFLPYIGPWLSAVLPLTVSLGISDGWTQPILVICLFIVLELIVNNVAEPLLYGSSIGVSGLGIIMAAIFWTWLWGAIGLVLAVPLTVCVVVAARYIPSLRFISVLLGDEPTLSMGERIYQRMLAFDEEEIQTLAAVELQGSTRMEFYQDVVIPALRLAERDRHAGVLTEEQEVFIADAARELVEMPEPPADEDDDDLVGAEPEPPKSNRPPVRILCIPLRDDGDAIGALMLRQLLAPEEVEILIADDKALTSELVDSVASLNAGAVVISILPPLPARDSRLLCRQLRKRHPSMSILIGYWVGHDLSAPKRRLCSSSDAEVCTTLEAMVERIRAIASRLRVAPGENGTPPGNGDSRPAVDAAESARSMAG